MSQEVAHNSPNQHIPVNNIDPKNVGDGEGAWVHLEEDLMQVNAKVFAIYGKAMPTDDLIQPVGGLFKLGKRVTQIGCDPKHDSFRSPRH